VPFFIRPITGLISGQVHKLLLDPEFKAELSFIEQQLKSSGGDFICGKDMAAADFMLGFCLEVCMGDDVGRPLTKEKFPSCVAYLERLKSRLAWKRALERVDQAGAEAEKK
jgi:glutathione S-transferase